MIPVSDQFLAALRGPHQLAVRAVAYPPTGGTVDLPILDGSVTIDRTADQRRRLDLTLAPNTVEGQSLYPESPTDAIAPYGTEIRVYRGIEFASSITEWVPLGVYRIEDVTRDLPGGEVTITAWDRSTRIVDQRFLQPRTFAKQNAITLIETLITEVYPTAVFHDSTGDSTKIPKHTVDRDRWAEIQRVAQVIGAEVFPDENGEWVIQPTPDPTGDPSVWSVDAGEGGVLVSLSDSVTRDQVPNGVVAIGDGPPTVFLADGFTRTTGTGWGTSGSGDDWSVASGSGSDFDTQNSFGRIQAAAGENKTIQSPVHDDADQDATAVIQFGDFGTAFGTAITGGDLQASLGLRFNSGGSTGVRINLTWDQSTGHVIARPQTMNSGSSNDIGGSDKNLGSYNLGDTINVRLRLVGDNVKAKAWISSEPKHWDWDTSQSVASNSGRAQARLNRGSGNTNGGAPQVGFDEIKVTATGTWYGIAHDDDPTSPTYWSDDDSAYGKVPVFFTHPHIRSQAQADRIARNQLRDHLGASRTITFDAVPNPALDAGDIILITRPNGTSETHLIDSLTIPLGTSGTQTGATRAKELAGFE